MSNFIYTRGCNLEEDATTIKDFFRRKYVVCFFNCNDITMFYCANLDEKTPKVFTIFDDSPLIPLLKEHGHYYSIEKIREESKYHIGDNIHILSFGTGIPDYKVCTIIDITQSNEDSYYCLVVDDGKGKFEIDINDITKGRVHEDFLTKTYIAPNLSMLQLHTTEIRNNIIQKLEIFANL